MRIYSEFQLILTLFSVAMDGIVVLSTEWATFYQTLAQTPITIIANAVELPKQYKYHSQSKQIITLGRLGERKHLRYSKISRGDSIPFSGYSIYVVW